MNGAKRLINGVQKLINGVQRLVFNLRLLDISENECRDVAMQRLYKGFR